MNLSEKILNYFSKLTPKDYAIIILSTLACGIFAALLQSCGGPQPIPEPLILSENPTEVCKQAVGEFEPKKILTLVTAGYSENMPNSIACVFKKAIGKGNIAAEFPSGSEVFQITDAHPKNNGFIVKFAKR
jgi:hypothetical protein